MSAHNKRWVLPDHVADALPAQARQIELRRRSMLEAASSFGYELVIPPLIEHLDSLLTGTGEALELQTFTLVDQVSGRTMGVRSDTTTQVARIDAHLLNRQGVTRLCYCGPVLHTHPATPHASREPLQFGAEIYGHAGLEADLEILQLALHVLHMSEMGPVCISLSDVRLLHTLTEGKVCAQTRSQLVEHLSHKDAPALHSLLDTRLQGLEEPQRQQLVELLHLHGQAHTVLAQARKALPAAHSILEQLQWLCAQLCASGLPEEALHVDLADVGDYGYYSAGKFVLFCPKSKDAVARGGRYDEVGAAFGRARAAVGFSLDIRTVAEATPPAPPQPSIRAPWGVEEGLRQAISRLRAQGETVVCVLPGHEHESDAFVSDRELVQVSGRWVVRSLG